MRCSVPEVPVTRTLTAFVPGVEDDEDEIGAWLAPPPPQPMCAATNRSNKISNTAICDRLRPEASKTMPKTGKVPNHSANNVSSSEETGGGGWTRTNDLGIMRPSL